MAQAATDYGDASDDLMQYFSSQPAITTETSTGHAQYAVNKNGSSEPKVYGTDEKSDTTSGDGKEPGRILWVLLILLLLLGFGSFFAKRAYDMRLAQIEHNQQAAETQTKQEIQDLRQNLEKITVTDGAGGGDVVVGDGVGSGYQAPGDASSSAANGQGQPGVQGVAGSKGDTGQQGIQGPQGPSGVATCPNGNCLSVQTNPTTTQEVGSIDVSGGGIFGGDVTANSFTGDGANLSNVDAATLGGQNGAFYQNANNLNSGTLSDSRLSANVTLQGNAFNGASQLVQLTSGGILPILDGSQLTNVVAANSTQLGGQGAAYYLNASNLNSGTLSDTLLSGNVTLQGNTFNGPNQLVQLTAGGILPVLNGSQLTNVDAQTLNGQLAAYYLNASNIGSGTLADARLSSNVALKNATNTFTGTNNFAGITATGILQNGYGVCDASNNCSYATSAQFANAILQGGNSFGTTMTIGTNDSQLLALKAGGVSSLFVATDGRVGVGAGATAPDYQLLVRSNVNDVEGIHVRNTSTGASAAAVVRINTEGSGDASVVLRVAGASTIWAAGIDTSDSGKFRIVPQGTITNGATLGVTITTGSFMGIGKTSPLYRLDVGGDINISSGYAYKINGVDICTASGCTTASGSTNYIQNQTASPQAADFNISGNGTIGSNLVVQGTISSPGSGDQSQKFGVSTTASGQYSLAVGHGAVASNVASIAIGRNASSTATGGTTIGTNSSVGAESVSIGYASSVSGAYAVGIGRSASVSNDRSIGIGYGATTTATNQLVVGSSITNLNQGYFGNGVTSSSPLSFTLNATGGSGTDIQGASLTLAGGRGTGTGAGGDIVFSTAGAGGSSNATLNNLSERMRITSAGRIGINTANPQAILDVAVNNGAAYSSTALPFASTSLQVSNLSDAANSGAFLRFAAGTSSQNIAYIGTIKGAGSGNLIFGTRDGGGYSEKMRIGGDGTISIGTTSSLGQLGIVNTNAAQVGLVVQGAASQTGNLQQWQSSSGTILASVNSTGQIAATHFRVDTAALGNGSEAFNVNNSGTQFFTIVKSNVGTSGLVNIISSISPTNRLLVLKGNATQTGDLLQAQDSSGNALAKIDATGNLTVKNASVEGAYISFSNNIRGYNVAVTGSATSQSVTFGTAHPDANYAVFCTPNWNTTCFVTNKTTSGFTLNYGTAAPSAQLVDWFVVR